MRNDQLDHAEQLLRELEQLEAQLNQLRDGMTQSHRLATLGTMASIIAHEFNNILTPVISYCQLALGDGADEALRTKALHRALDGSQRAAQVCSSMLGFAGESDGPASANLARAIDDVFTCLARDPQRDGITLKVQVPGDLHAAITPVALQQVLLNLVLNARQAMRRRGGTLTLTAEAMDGRTVRIVVADTGPGIPPRILPDIFEPFVTQRDADERGRKGTGLGLAVCRNIIAQAGGAIDVESSSAGAVFSIELPRAEPTAQPMDTPSRLAS